VSPVRLDTVSTDSGRGGGAVPSFGDLFDEPDAPVGAELGEAAPAPAAAGAQVIAGRSLDEGDRGAEADGRAEPDEANAPDGIEPAAAAVDDEKDGDPVGEMVPPLAGLAAADPVDTPHPPEPLDENPVAASPDLAPSLAAAAGAAAAAAAPPVQTGRLFRSSGAEGPATLDAIPAIDPEYMAAREAQRAEEARRAPRAPRAPKAEADGESGLTWTGVVVVVLLGTVLVGFADAIINDSLGILTGLALLVSSVYCAVLVRPSDIWAAVVVPPLAFLAAALTAGQLTLDSAGSFVVREGYMLLKTMAQNAPWIIGTTAVCLVIVLVRRRRSSTETHA